MLLYVIIWEPRNLSCVYITKVKAGAIQICNHRDFRGHDSDTDKRAN